MRLKKKVAFVQMLEMVHFIRIDEKLDFNELLETVKFAPQLPGDPVK